MNFALSDEQVLLREAARGALSRFKTIEAARAALEDSGALPDLWPTAVEAGWPGLLINEEAGGAGLGAFDALLVAEECGRVLASVPLLGLLPATAILDAAGDESLSQIAAGELRPVYVPARPPGETEPGWTVDPATGFGRAAAPRATVSGDQVQLTGEVAFVPDAPGAEMLVAIGQTEAGDPVAVAIESGASGVTIEPVIRYDATRSMAHVRFEQAGGRRLSVDADAVADAWYLAHALIAAESLGAVQTCLDVSVVYAKERFTFGRAIGSYQGIKHELTEVLRGLENARGLQYYAGWARESMPAEFPLAASAARSVAGRALDFAARSMINVHGGIGATWEHDAPLFFRRAQLSRRLLAGTHDATDRVAGETLELGRVMPRRALAGVVVAACAIALAAGAASGASRWVPPKRLTWYWQLQGRIDNSEAASAYDVDGFDTSAQEVATLHAQGKHVICYIDVGTWENWRPDAGKFPRSVLGDPNGWPGERWLDIRRRSVLGPIMTARMKLCARKHFDAVEPDNIDGYENKTGFPLTAREQLSYDEWVAREAHGLGLAVFQKNDPEQVKTLQPYFDGVLDEQCNQYQECSSFRPYLRAGKPVLNAEYRRSLYPGFCGADARAGIMGALYGLALNGAVYRPCWSSATIQKFACIRGAPGGRWAASSELAVAPLQLRSCVLAHHPPVAPLGAHELLTRGTG